MSQLVLVTGASGFVGAWCVRELLLKGYKVRGTVRDTNNDKKTAFLKALPGAETNLELVNLDLLGPEGDFETAAKGCNFILHTASPFPISAPKDADDLVIPAMEGTLKMLRAAKAVGLNTRVVVTSSVAAVCAGHTKENGEQYTEADWSVENLADIGAYQLSKTKAERAAWKFMEDETPGYSLCTVNPCLVMGPCLNSELGMSQEILKRILNKELPACPKLSFQLVDVRDVAKCHVLAMETAPENAGRFICAGDAMWMQDMAKVLAVDFVPMGYSIPTGALPYAAMWLISWFDSAIAGVLKRWGNDDTADGSKATKILGFEYSDSSKMLVDQAHSLIHHGHVAAKDEYKPGWTPADPSSE